MDSEAYVTTLESLLVAYYHKGCVADFMTHFDSYEKYAQRINYHQSEAFLTMLIQKLYMMRVTSPLDDVDKLCDEILNRYSDRKNGNNRLYRELLYFKACNYEWANKDHLAREVLESCYSLIGDTSRLKSDDDYYYFSGLLLLDSMLSDDLKMAENKAYQSLEYLKKSKYTSHQPYMRLGKIELSKGNVLRALDFYTLAQKRLNGKNKSVDYVSIIDDMAYAYYMLGNYQEAMRLVDNAINDVMSLCNNQPNLTLASLLEVKCRFLYSIGDYNKSKQVAKEALNIRDKFLGSESLNSADLYLKLFQCNTQLYEWKSATDNINVLSNILSKYHGEDHDIEFFINLCFLDLYTFKGDNKEFEGVAKKCEQCIDSYELSPQNIEEFYRLKANYFMINGLSGGEAFYKKYKSFSEGRKHTEAEDLSSKLILLTLQQYYERETISIADRLALLDLYKETYRSKYLYLNSEEREKFINGWYSCKLKDILFVTEDDVAAPFLYDYLMYSKNLLLESQHSISEAVYSIADTSLINKYNEMQGLKSRFLELSAKEIHQLTVLEREILSHVQNADDMRRERLSYENVQKALFNADVAIEFVCYSVPYSDEEKYAALVLSNDMSSPLRIELCNSDDLNILFKQHSVEYLCENNFVGNQIYTLLWEKLEPYLKSAQNVYFSPDGILHQIPIEYICDKYGKRLYQKYNLVRLSSTKILCDINSEENKSPKKIVLYGGLKYDNPQIDDTMPSSGTRSGWKYLSGTLTEVNNILALATKERLVTKAYTSYAGTEESLKEVQEFRPDILHFATHGFYLEVSEAIKNPYISNVTKYIPLKDYTSSSMIRSGLLLSGGNLAWCTQSEDSKINDGVLTSMELQGLDLSTVDVLVLSACQTGLGEITHDGVWGLQRAFKKSGVDTIIMSLWEVDDEATSLLMRSFYKRLFKNNNKREAFNYAINNVKKKYPSPEYWAAFIMLD